MAKKILTQDTTNYNNVQALPDLVEEQSTLVKQTFDKAGNDQKTFMNSTHIAELQSSATGTSGSYCVGHGSASITADNTGDALEENRLLINTLQTADVQNVKLTGNQTIAGTKTFSSNVEVPTPPTLSTHATSKEYVDSKAPLTVPDNSITNLKLATDVKVGSLATLTTDDKSDVVSAINEVDLKAQRHMLGGGYLINGDFSINQREVSGTVVLAPGEYGHDRFKGGATGCTYTFASSGGVTTLTILSGSLIQVIEGVNLDTGTYVLSWQGTSQGKIGAGSYGFSGITSSVTGGSNLSIEFNTGTLSKCKFELGNVSTSFVQNKLSQELLDCLRYTEVLKGGTNGAYGLAIAITTTLAVIIIPKSVDSRIRIPTTTFSGSFNLVGTSTQPVTGIANSGTLESEKSVSLSLSVASGLVVGNVYQLRNNSDANAYIRFDYEI